MAWPTYKSGVALFPFIYDQYWLPDDSIIHGKPLLIHIPQKPFTNGTILGVQEHKLVITARLNYAT